MTNIIYPQSSRVLKARLKQEHVWQKMELLKRHHGESYAHSVRVGLLSVDIGHENEVEEMCLLADSALLHDIGKVCVPLEVLAKPGALNEEELKVMRSHPRKGFELLADPLYENIRKVGIGHHEYQSHPYPRKESREVDAVLDPLKQIIAVADKYDALTNKRAYKPALARSVVEELLRTQFTGNQKYVDQVLRR